MLYSASHGYIFKYKVTTRTSSTSKLWNVINQTMKKNEQRQLFYEAKSEISPCLIKLQTCLLYVLLQEKQTPFNTWLTNARNGDSKFKYN